MLSVDKNLCDGCAECLAVCPDDAITLKDGKAEIVKDCIECYACVEICPKGAIK